MRSRLFAVLLVLIALFSPPSLAKSTKEYVMLAQDRIMVWSEGGTYGEIPLKGFVGASHLLRMRPLLVVHLPKEGIFAVIDVRPYSPFRFQTLALYQSPSLCYADTQIVELERRVFLLQGSKVLARLDLEALQLELSGLEAIPVPIVPGRIVLGNNAYYLDQGSLFCERPDAKPPVPYPISLDQSPLDLLKDRRFLYVLTRGAVGGGVVVIDPQSSEEILQFPLAEAPLSMVLDGDNRLVVLLENGMLGIIDPIQRRWIRKWRPFLPRRPLRLLPA